MESFKRGKKMDTFLPRSYFILLRSLSFLFLFFFFTWLCHARTHQLLSPVQKDNRCFRMGGKVSLRYHLLH